MPKGVVPFPFGKCAVCNAQATGVHYGAATCEGCKGFFKRSLEKSEKYKCPTDGNCQVGPENRIKCKKCRFNKCLQAGMSMEAIKMGRIPKSEKQKALDMEGVSAAELSKRDNLEAPPEPKLSRNQTERPILPQPNVSQPYPAQPYNSVVPGQINAGSSIHQNGYQYQQSQSISYTDPTNDVAPSLFNSAISFDDETDPPPQNQQSRDQAYARSLAAANNNNYQWQQQQVNKSHQQQHDNQPLAIQGHLKIQQKQQQHEQQRLQEEQHRQQQEMLQRQNLQQEQLRQQQEQRQHEEMLQQQNLHQQKMQNVQYRQQNLQYSSPPSKTTLTHDTGSAKSYSQSSPTALLNQQAYPPTTANSFNHVYQQGRLSEQTEHSAVQLNTPSSSAVQKNLQHQPVTSQHSNSQQLYSQNSYSREPYQNNQRSEYALPPQQSLQAFYDQTRSQYNVSSWIANNPQPQPILYDQPSPQSSLTSSHHYEYNTSDQTSQTGSQLSVSSPHDTHKNGSPGRRSPAMSEAISVGEPDSAYASSCISEAQSSAVDANTRIIEQELDEMNCAALIRKVAEAYWICTETIREAATTMEDCIENGGASDQTLRVKEENLPKLWEWLMESVNFYNGMILEFIKGCPGFTYLETEDQTALIRHAYLPVWLIWNAPLFKSGDTHILFLNGYRYPRAWMQKILPHDFVEYLHEYAERQNNARLSINELSILTTLALTPSNVPGLTNPHLVSKVHEKYKTALNYEVTRQRVNPKEMLAEIPHFLLHLNTAVARQEIILNFNEQNPPVITFDEEEDNKKRDWQTAK